MHHCHVDPSIWSDTEILLPASSEHHLINVLRVSSGEMLSIFDGMGNKAVARVAFEKGRRVVLKVVEKSSVPKPVVSFSLLQAIPKGTRMDLIVEKATELGVNNIYPLITERVVLRLTDGAKREERRSRWQRIAINAAEQSGVSWMPEVKPVSDIEETISIGRNFDVFLVGALSPDARALRDVMGEVRKNNPATAGLLIGPEGDLTPLELKLAVDAGAIPVNFGPNVFRVETAAIFGLSVMAYEMGR